MGNRSAVPASVWKVMDKIRQDLHLAMPDDLSELLTVLQYAEKYGVARRTAADHIAKMVKTGKLTLAYIKGKEKFYRFLK